MNPIFWDWEGRPYLLWGTTFLAVVIPILFVFFFKRKSHPLPKEDKNGTTTEKGMPIPSTGKHEIVEMLNNTLDRLNGFKAGRGLTISEIEVLHSLTGAVSAITEKFKLHQEDVEHLKLSYLVSWTITCLVIIAAFVAFIYINW